MFVTDIKAINNKRYEIYLDNKLAFILYKGELRSFDIEKECELSEDIYGEIVTKILPKRALLRLGHLLEKRDYTEKQLRLKLEEAAYPAEAIDYAIGKVKSYGFVDDLRYALRYIECSIDKKSKRQIQAKLYNIGIAKDIIDQAFECAYDNGLVQDEDRMIRTILEKRHYYDKEVDAKERAKQFNYLLGKGYNIAAIKRCINLTDSEDY